ncbi:TonB-dependent receptor [Sphingomonas sp. CGMCC 1.13654]|uniref:TonB-dependent receptor n=1 Tax=Sphingomonas chungangi TaxID=2683589 RepID=A0A838L4C1_9SPHN|nr:TonB-dependent receptor [Sphingomonas chungangi]MBA2934004.1 TonB-dependent receptor [Sphingomonas chungangi]MVW57750.1 TonB-dependent receptor [Sphingomonas chungangi]
MTHKTLLLALLAGTATPALAQADTAPAPAAAPASEPVQEIVVTGNANREGLRKLDASYSISTASAEQIRQVQPISTADLLKIVPGVWVETSGGESGANVFIRGFPSSGDAPFLTLEMNGSPIIAPSSLSFLEDSSVFRIDDTVERMEVLRGGPSPIFANGQPGATTNFILKEGTQDPHLSLRATYGTEGTYRGDFVAQGPIDPNTTYMIGGFYRYSDGYRHTGFTGDLGGQITGSVTHKFDGGKINVYGRYLDDKNAFYTPMPLATDGNGHVSTLPGFDARDDTLVGKEIENTQIEVGPSINGGPTQKKQVDLSRGRGARIYTFGSTFSYDLGGGFTVQNNMNFTKGQANTFALFTGDNPQTVDQYLNGRAGSVTYADSGQALAGNAETIQAGIWAVEKHIQSFTDELKLSKELFEGNTLTVGGYYAHVKDHDIWNLGNSVLLALEPQARVLNASLDDGTQLTRDGFTSANSYDVNAYYKSDNVAGYVSDEWKIGKLRIDGGVRVEHTKITDHSENSSTGDLDNNPLTAYNNNAAYLNGTWSDLTYKKTQVSWTVGADYAITNRLNAFVRANQGALLPQFDDLRNNFTTPENIKPQKARQYEVGIKTSTHYYDLYLTGFYNRFHDLLLTQILADGSSVVGLSGSRAYGVEFEGAVRPIEGVQIGFRGVYQNGKYLDYATKSGNQVPRQPKFQFAIMPQYTFRTDWGQARVFGTYTHVGKRFADDSNLQPLAKYDTLDLGASIDLKENFSIQATVENVTNTLALTEGNVRTLTSGTDNGYFLGRPIFGRHATITAAYKF